MSTAPVVTGTCRQCRAEGVPLVWPSVVDPSCCQHCYDRKLEDLDRYLSAAQVRILPPPQNELRLALDEVGNEVARARSLHAPMHGPHEGYAVILEELDELWDEVRAKHQDRGRMRAEAVQVAAMALRFILDVCGEER